MAGIEQSATRVALRAPVIVDGREELRFQHVTVRECSSKPPVKRFARLSKREKRSIKPQSLATKAQNLRISRTEGARKALRAWQCCSDLHPCQLNSAFRNSAIRGVRGTLHAKELSRRTSHFARMADAWPTNTLKAEKQALVALRDALHALRLARGRPGPCARECSGYVCAIVQPLTAT